MKIIVVILISSLGSFVLAHNGHSHSSSPAGSSRTKFGSSSDNESPLSLSFKVRSGYEYGNYMAGLPSINSYFGEDELNLNLNYEFQIRQFSSEQQSEYQDQDYNNHFTAQVKKSISDKVSFSLTGEYVLNQAVRVARMINDNTYTGLNAVAEYRLENEWTLAGGYLFSMRQFPNGTYLVPTSSPTGVGEPITPNEQPTINEPITLAGVTDNLNELSMSIGGDVGSQTINFEGKYILNNSDLGSRKYTAQAFRVALEKMLFARIFAQISYSTESRTFADRTDTVGATELGLQRDLSARMSVLAIARNIQLTSQASGSLWEGYAQLQYTF